MLNRKRVTSIHWKTLKSQARDVVLQEKLKENLQDKQRETGKEIIFLKMNNTCLCIVAVDYVGSRSIRDDQKVVKRIRVRVIG
jgi:hypothetical protein